MPSRNEGVEARTKRLDQNRPAEEQLADIQRSRLLAAMTEVCAEHGAGNATVARVVERAGVSRRTFYELFNDREECFLAAFEDGLARASRYVLHAYDPTARWADRVRTSLFAALSFLDAERGVGQLLIVGSLGAGAEALERRRYVLAQITDVIDEARTEEKVGSGLPSLTAEGVLGGVLSVIHARLLDTRSVRLVELTGPLMSMIVMPYLGLDAARRELKRPMPKPAATPVRADGDPLRGLGMRLTYRTVCVLTAVAATPGSSNREIGVAAGISDQGQTSKLLGRLERLGLVNNAGLAPGKGTPNAWVLTEKGTRVERSVDTYIGHRSLQMSGRSAR
jgi:AcrR family transcriptional regulator